MSWNNELPFMWTCIFLIIQVSKQDSLPPPDYESQWLSLTAQSQVNARVDAQHGFGEKPILVDVQVKAIDGPNKGFIFPAVGGVPRDDDHNKPYGGVVYIYNNVYLTAVAPLRNNQYRVGKAIYTGDGVYYTGPNYQSSMAVKVKFRAWKESSLPPADFKVSDIPIQTGSSSASEVYVERQHDFGIYPSIVVVRSHFADGWTSNAVGSSILSHNSGRNNYVVYGFSDSSVRVWVSSQPEDTIFAGVDGYGLPAHAYKSGMLEILAWKPLTLPPWFVYNTELGTGITGEQFQHGYNLHQDHIDDIVFTIWAESMTGSNAGFRFPGSGAVAYDVTNTDSTCSYGGLVYGYRSTEVRFWRPTDILNGGVVCIASPFGDGTNTQLETNARIRVFAWKTEERSVSNFEPEEEKCVHVKT